VPHVQKSCIAYGSVFYKDPNFLRIINQRNQTAKWIYKKNP